MSEIIKIEYYVKTNKVGSECSDVAEYDRDEWENMTDDEREEEMKELAFNEMEWGFSEIEASGDE